jgi:hypothetical protein
MFPVPGRPPPLLPPILATPLGTQDAVETQCTVMCVGMG